MYTGFLLLSKDSKSELMMCHVNLREITLLLKIYWTEGWSNASAHYLHIQIACMDSEHKMALGRWEGYIINIASDGYNYSFMIAVADFSLNRNIACDHEMAVHQMNPYFWKSSSKKVTKQVVIHVGEYFNSFSILLIGSLSVFAWSNGSWSSLILYLCTEPSSSYIESSSLMWGYKKWDLWACFHKCNQCPYKRNDIWNKHYLVYEEKIKMYPLWSVKWYLSRYWT